MSPVCQTESNQLNRSIGSPKWTVNGNRIESAVDRFHLYSEWSVALPLLRIEVADLELFHVMRGEEYEASMTHVDVFQGLHLGRSEASIEQSGSFSLQPSTVT